MEARAILIVGCSVLAAPALAAPPEVLNKTVTSTYSVTIPARGEDGREYPDATRQGGRIIYISSAGRLFVRATRRDSSRGGSASAVYMLAPGDTYNTFRFEGSKLVGTLKMISGAAQLTISFGAGGTSCQTELIVGREGGKPLRWKGASGLTFEQTGPVKVSNQACRIENGNVFAH